MRYAPDDAAIDATQADAALAAALRRASPEQRVRALAVGALRHLRLGGHEGPREAIGLAAEATSIVQTTDCGVDTAEALTNLAVAQLADIVDVSRGEAAAARGEEEELQQAKSLLLEALKVCSTARVGDNADAAALKSKAAMALSLAHELEGTLGEAFERRADALNPLRQQVERRTRRASLPLGVTRAREVAHALRRAGRDTEALEQLSCEEDVLRAFARMRSVML